MALTNRQRKMLNALAARMVRNRATVWKPHRVNRSKRIEKPKECSYCGGKVGQGFKEITIPKIARMRICAPCMLSIFNWVMNKIKEEQGVQDT